MLPSQKLKATNIGTTIAYITHLGFRSEKSAQDLPLQQYSEENGTQSGMVALGGI